MKSRPQASAETVPQKNMLSVQVCAALLLMSCAMATAKAEIAQQSLIVKEPKVVEPNLMFTLDDSGSMVRNFLPETKNDVRVYAIHPGEPSVYYFDIDGVLPTTDDHLLSMRRRSARVNTLYYDPEVQYTPWVDENGNYMPQADPKAAWYHKGYPGSALENKDNAALVRTIASLRLNLEGAQPVGKDTLSVCASVLDEPKKKCTPMTGVTTIYPATYYDYIGPEPASEADLRKVSNFRRVSIATHAGNFTRGKDREDCKRVDENTRSCTRAQEYQNFANWFQYHRTRMHVAIAGVGKAFNSLNGDVRVGFGRINKVTAGVVDGTATKVIERGVRRFEGDDKKAFFTWLNSQIADGSTPLVESTRVVGEYFKRADNNGPWSAEPGKGDSTPHLSCRRSYHLLMTDGLYNFEKGYSPDKSSFTLESDNVAGTTITGTNREDGSSLSYRYVPQRPYASATRGTLADYAMDYWKNDLRPNLENDVPVIEGSGNEAFWQHLTMYTLSFGVSGSTNLDPEKDLEALKNGTKKWPDVINEASPETVDDLWHAALNSRGRYLNVQQGRDFADRVNAILGEIKGRIGRTGSISIPTQALGTKTQKFIPSFNTSGWSGSLDAFELDPNGVQLGLQWSAPDKMPVHSARNIFVGTGEKTGPRSVAFTWNNPAWSAGVKTQLLTGSGLPETRGKALLDWLRGDGTGEVEGTQGFPNRVRKVGNELKAPIGHIVHSTPTYIGAAIDRGYAVLPATLGTDKATGAASYKAYVKKKAAGTARPGLVFIGSNDGYLHAFNAATGEEAYAFVPFASLEEFGRSARLDYKARFLMDGPLLETDVFMNGKWANILLGTSGAGPRAVFALDVTSTKNLNAQTLMWELSGDKTQEIGHVLAAPEVGVMHDGTWVAIFGNGYESASKRAQLVIVDLATGDIVKMLDTGVGTAASPNGLGGVRVLRDGNNVITGAYAGDLRGNVWKFDLASQKRSEWRISFGGSPLFTVKGAGGQALPITAAPMSVTHLGGGSMVLVGSGKLFETGDEKSTQQQAIFGLWDKELLNMGADGVWSWQGGSTIKDSEIRGRTVERVRDSGGSFVSIKGALLDWSKDRGWRIPLTMIETLNSTYKGQRNIVQPQMVTGLALFETMTPVLSRQDAENACLARVRSPAFNVLVDPLSGTMAEKALIDTDGDGRVSSADKAVGGWQVADWSGRSVVLAEPASAPCQGNTCTQQARANSCPPKTLRSAIINADDATTTCVPLPTPSRWWWRELSVPDKTYEAGVVLPPADAGSSEGSDGAAAGG